MATEAATTDTTQTGAATTDGATSSTSDSQASASQTSSQAAATTAQSTGFFYQEDRSKWLPPHRFNEVNDKYKTTNAENERLKAQVAALTNTQPKDEKTQKAEQVREAFFQMFPAMRKFSDLTDEQIDRLLQSPEVASRASEVEQREWRRHGQAQMGVVFSKVADALGQDALKDSQKQRLSSDFSRWFKGRCKAELDASAGEESKTFSRYEDGDATLLDEYVKEYLADFVEPARRVATTQNINRTRAVPNSQGRGQVTQSTRPEKFKSLDERLDYAASLMKEQGHFASR